VFIDKKETNHVLNVSFLLIKSARFGVAAISKFKAYLP